MTEANARKLLSTGTEHWVPCASTFSSMTYFFWLSSSWFRDASDITNMFCRYDWARTARLCAFNGFMGLFGHYYYGYLDKTISVSGSSRSLGSILSKISIDQLVFSPICTFIFYVFKISTEGRIG